MRTRESQNLSFFFFLEHRSKLEPPDSLRHATAEQLLSRAVSESVQQPPPHGGGGGLHGDTPSDVTRPQSRPSLHLPQVSQRA
jgi:hypothetical protein